MSTRDYYKLPEAAEIIGCNLIDLVHYIVNTKIRIAILLRSVPATLHLYNENGFYSDTHEICDTQHPDEEAILTGLYYLKEEDSNLLDITYNKEHIRKIPYQKNHNTLFYHLKETNDSTWIGEENIVIDTSDVDKLRLLIESKQEGDSTSINSPTSQTSNERLLSKSVSWLDLEKKIQKAVNEFPAWEKQQSVWQMPDIDAWLNDIGICNVKAIEVAKAVLSDYYTSIESKRGKKAKPLTTIEKIE